MSVGGGKKWNGSRLILLTRPLLGVKGEVSKASWAMHHQGIEYELDGQSIRHKYEVSQNLSNFVYKLGY